MHLIMMLFKLLSLLLYIQFDKYFKPLTQDISTSGYAIAKKHPSLIQLTRLGQFPVDSNDKRLEIVVSAMFVRASCVRKAWCPVIKTL